MIRLALLILLVVCPAWAFAEDQAVTPDRARGLELWSRIHQVFSHPRCANCHVGTDRVPMWSGPEFGAAPRPHGMNISARGADNISAEDADRGVNYLVCTTCHSKQNSLTPHGPPGATKKGVAEWQLAPVEMQWFGKSSAEICEQFKAPESNGHLETIPALVRHVTTEPLVLWAWTVDPERRPPYSAKELGELVEAWGGAGEPCPSK